MQTGQIWFLTLALVGVMPALGAIAQTAGISCGCFGCQSGGLCYLNRGTSQQDASGDQRIDDEGVFPGAPDAGIGSIRIRNRWGRTATHGSTPNGSPVTLTWGIVPDGTALPNEEQEDGSIRNDPSSLVAFLDTQVGSIRDTLVTDLQQKSWFPIFKSAYDRWSELSGITFVYEPNDDGVFITSGSGILGTRADMRVGGHFVDGQSGPNTLAYNYFPNAGDMVIDTGNTGFYGNSGGNFLRLRNVLMHEIGHGIGFNHVVSNNSSQLMEPFISTGFDGPQIDDIAAVHRSYGDVLEKNGGNNFFTSATPQGSLGQYGDWSRGKDADFTAPGTEVRPDQVDFVSIDDSSDNDFFSFTATASGLLDLRVKPVGPVYNEGAQGGSTQNPFDLRSQARLFATILNSRGSQLASGRATLLGDTVTIDDFEVIAGEQYYARVGSFNQNVQLYRIDAAINPKPNDGTTFDLASSTAFGRNFSITEEGVTLNLTADAGNNRASLQVVPEGLGIFSSGESSTDDESFRIGRSGLAQETLLVSFDQDVFIENIALTELDEGTLEGLIVRPETGDATLFPALTGYEDSDNFTIAANGFRYREPDYQSEIANISFGIGDQSRFFLAAGTVLEFLTSGASGGGILINSLTVTATIPEPTSALLLAIFALSFTGRRSGLRNLH